MKTVGFFQELNPKRPSVYQGNIADSVTTEALPDEKAVVSYLRGGCSLLDVMGAEEDVLGSGRHIVGGASLMTDGEWLWREDLQFYVTNYHLRLPDEFLAAIRRNNYRVPDVSVATLREVGEEALQLLGFH